MTDTTILLAELHAAGYGNEKIGYLLPEYGATRARSRTTVRDWALGNAEPRASDWDALKRLHAALIGIKAPAEFRHTDQAE